MTDFLVPLFRFPAVRRKPVTAAFDGGRLTSNGGVMLAMAERRRQDRRPAGGVFFRPARSDGASGTAWAT